MIDLAAESLLSLGQAAKLVPPGRNGKKTHLSTILRWITHGAKDPNGELVRSAICANTILNEQQRPFWTKPSDY